MSEKLTKFLREYIIPAIIGLLFFVIVYGVTPLDVTNDAWIMAGYDEDDLTQHYAGWVQFRSSDWTFPLGLIEDMADGTGTMVSFTDSIPILAIVFKTVDFMLPETFQYFGWYNLVCFILQAIAGYKLVQRKSKNPVLGYVGMSLFLLSPILLERAFRHTALASHWFILFSLLIYLKSRDARREGRQIFSKGYLVLNILTVWIHPYFLPMVMIFTALTAWENALQFRSYVKNGLFLIGNAVAAFMAGWLIGALGWGVESSRFGYGYFSMNLNALVNPKSLGGYDWSKFLDELPQMGGNYDGFNYLGMGILLLLVPTTVFGVKKWKECTHKKQWIKDNVTFVLAMLFLTAFAISNIVSFNDAEILKIPIPYRVYELCGIFRASARIFYPVYYVIYTYVIYQLAELKKEKIALAVLTAGLAFQVVDLSGVITEKHQQMQENSTYQSLLDDKELQKLAEGHTKVTVSEAWDVIELQRISAWAGKNGLKTSFSIANSGVYPEADAKASEEIEGLKAGDYDKTIIYVTQNIDVYKNWLRNLAESEITKYYYNDYYYLIPNLE